MNRFGMCLATLLALTATTYATDYNFVGVTQGWPPGSTADDWNQPAVWDVGSSFPQSASDRAFITNGNRVDAQMNLSSPVTYTLGNLVVANGSSMWMWSRDYTFNLDNSAGQGGNFWYTSTTNCDTYAAPSLTINCDGNFYFAGSGIFGSGFYLKMKGNNTALRHLWSYSPQGTIEIAGKGVWDNNSQSSYEDGWSVVIDHGASIGTSGSSLVDGHWYARSFTFVDGQANLPAYGSNVDFHYGCLQADNGNFLAVAGGVYYPRDVQVAAQTYWYPEMKNSVYTWKIKDGDVHVGRDLTMSANNSTGTFVLDLSDCGTGASRNLIVNRNIDVYTQQTADRRFLLKFENADVKVGGFIRLGRQSNYWANYAAVNLGGSTVHLGGDFIVYYPTAFVKANWNAGTSTIICDGNGTHQSQTLNTYGSEGLALNNLVINNPGGIVTLASVGAYETSPAPNLNGGELLLHGDFKVLAGTFNQNKQAIKFNGPAHTLLDSVGTHFDCMVLLSGAVVNLGSNILMDNIELDGGSKLYLMGFQLKGDGKTWNSASVSELGVPYENGTIFGTMAVPEPATLMLLGTGTLGALGLLRRRRTM